MESIQNIELVKRLVNHVGHEITCVYYGIDNENIAIECLNCFEILIDLDA